MSIKINWNFYRDKKFSICNKFHHQTPWILTLDSALRFFQSSIGQFAGLTTAKVESVRHLPLHRQSGFQWHFRSCYTFIKNWKVCIQLKFDQNECINFIQSAKRVKKESKRILPKLETVRLLRRGKHFTGDLGCVSSSPRSTSLNVNVVPCGHIKCKTSKQKKNISFLIKILVLQLTGW